MADRLALKNRGKFKTGFREKCLGGRSGLRMGQSLTCLKK